MIECKLLGLDVEPDDDLLQPLEIAAVVKGLDSDGDVAYWIVTTSSLQPVEIIGMMTWGVDVALHGNDEEET